MLNTGVRVTFPKLAMFVLIPLALLPNITAAQEPPIDILLGVSPAAYAQTDPFTIANRMEERIQESLDNSGMGGRDVNVYAYPIPTTFTFDGAYTTGQILEWMEDGDDSAFADAREGLPPYVTVQGFDLVVMVVAQFGPGESSKCGSARVLTNYNNVNNSEEKAFIVLKSTDFCLESSQRVIFAHEFGHTLGAEHQLEGFPGYINGDTTPSSPVDYNHPVATSNAHTVMAVPENFDPDKLFSEFSRSATNDTLGSTGVPAGDITKDSRRLFSQVTWRKVAAYRPIQPPDSPNCFVTMPFCPSMGQANLIFSYFPTTTGGPVNEYQVRRAYGDGPWGPVIEGLELGCIGLLGAAHILNRFKVTAIGPAGAATCETVIIPTCEGGGPPGI